MVSFFLEKKSTNSTPYVLIDESKNYMQFEGLSFHENAIEFFKDIVEWLGGYVETDFGTFTFDCQMKYFNSSTIKILYDMLDLMNENSVDGKNVIVNWHVNKDDDLLIELCEDMKEDYENLEINMIVS